MTAVRDPASFRDPAGHVFHLGDRVLRSIRSQAAVDYRFLRDAGVLAALSRRGWLIECCEVDCKIPEDGVAHVVEHPKLPFISYPYEWGFRALRAAALLTLDIHLELLRYGATLADGSAFNVQFQGATPVFIDLLSLRQYREGDFWTAQKQFCENFLAPLLLRAARGVPHNGWFRGAMEGIPSREAAALLPWHWKLRWTVLSNLVLPVYFQGRHGGLDSDFDAAWLQTRRLPRPALLGLLQGLREFIAGLSPRGSGAIWQDYERHQSYDNSEQLVRDGIVADFVSRLAPAMLWDMGCNAGHFSLLALKAGARTAIGFDSDADAVDMAFARSERANLNFLPLVLDAANPSPSQGWAQAERAGVAERRNANAVIALAFLHHLVVARNIPLEEAVNWLVGLAPSGLIEFVPRHDRTVLCMTALRRGASFDNYTEEAFVASLERRAQIVARHEASATGRRIFEFRRISA